MVLQVLDGIDLKSMGHNSEQYVHTVAQAIELVMADREAFVGDPNFVDVPLEQLLSKHYAALRRQLITDKAFDGLPTAGAPLDMQAVGQRVNLTKQVASLYNKDIGKDTSYLSIVDKDGNAVSMTPSDFPNSPMVTDTGMTLGIRMTQFRLDKSHPSSLAPGKRPRVTPHAVMLLNKSDQSLYMSLGTPGGRHANAGFSSSLAEPLSLRYGYTNSNGTTAFSLTKLTQFVLAAQLLASNLGFRGRAV